MWLCSMERTEIDEEEERKGRWEKKEWKLTLFFKRNKEEIKDEK